MKDQFPITRTNLILLILLLNVSSGLNFALASETTLQIERITTIAPFPRGLAMVEGKLYVLCRGRVRGAGGVSSEIDDQAGTIYVVDPNVSEPVSSSGVSHRVRTNGEVFARPTSPPFKLWDRTADPPEADRFTDRPYCTLRYHETTKSFYLCAFSGIDKKRSPADLIAFSKNLTDAILRYDTRTESWHEVERHNLQAGGNYPHHDPGYAAPPHGWLNGADNCLAIGDQLYAVGKDNSMLVRYDLSGLIDDPQAGPPPSEVVLGRRVFIESRGERVIRGHSALAYHDGWLYLATRTSSDIVRLRLDDDLLPVMPLRVQLVAKFDPYDPATGHSANITDIDIDDRGRVYVVSAKPARIYRFLPDPEHLYGARREEEKPWADLAALTGNPGMKSENILFHEGWLYVTSGDGYDYQHGADGTVYRIKVES